MSELNPFIEAVKDFFDGIGSEELAIETSYGTIETMPLEVFFRQENELTELENRALEICNGHILDVGAGIGAISLLLQARKKQVTALEISPELVSMMNGIGVEEAIQGDIMSFSRKKFDTLLMLMNGIGLVANVEGLEVFLQRAGSLLNRDGQLLFDSSDISYLYEDMAPPSDKYMGELSYRYLYKGLKGEWFKWLYIDQDLLIEKAKVYGWNTEILFTDEYGQYLAKLTKK